MRDLDEVSSGLARMTVCVPISYACGPSFFYPLLKTICAKIISLETGFRKCDVFVS